MKTNIPNSLFIRNRANLMARLPEKSVAVFTANEPMPRNGDQFYPFRQQSDFFFSVFGRQTETKRTVGYCSIYIHRF